MIASHAIPLAFSLVEECCERVASELLLVAFSRHGPLGESVAPPSSSQFRRAVAPVLPRPRSIPPDSGVARALVRRIGSQRLKVVPASSGKVGGRERLPVKALRDVHAARDGGGETVGHGAFRF